MFVVDGGRFGSHDASMRPRPIDRGNAGDQDAAFDQGVGFNEAAAD